MLSDKSPVESIQEGHSPQEMEASPEGEVVRGRSSKDLLEELKKAEVELNQLHLQSSEQVTLINCKFIGLLLSLLVPKNNE